MDVSRLNRTRVVLGGVGSGALILSILFLPWFTLTKTVGGLGGGLVPRDIWICGANNFDCTGFQTFPLGRWFLLLCALAPPILAWILLRGHKLGWPPGELTMVAGFSAMVWIAYNGLVDKPGSGNSEIGVGLDYGYFIALFAAIAIGVTGYLRSLEMGGRKARKAPGTI